MDVNNLTLTFSCFQKLGWHGLLRYVRMWWCCKISSCIATNRDLDTHEDYGQESLTVNVTLPAALPPDCTSLIAWVIATYVCHNFHAKKDFWAKNWNSSGSKENETCQVLPMSSDNQASGNKLEAFIHECSKSMSIRLGWHQTLVQKFRKIL